METTMNEKIISVRVGCDYDSGLINYYEEDEYKQCELHEFDIEEARLHEIEIKTDKGTKIFVTHDKERVGDVRCFVKNYLVRSEGDMPMIGDTLYAIEIEGYFLKLKTNKGYITFTAYSGQDGGGYSKEMDLTITKNGKETTNYITGKIEKNGG